MRWRLVRTDNPPERTIREIRWRIAARLRHIASAKWGKRWYLAMELLLNPAKQEAAAWNPDQATAKKTCDLVVALTSMPIAKTLLRGSVTIVNVNRMPIIRVG
jgi:hypothetical protein